jgi:3'(2'), 5'-bisphosphate nucleotidase
MQCALSGEDRVELAESARLIAERASRVICDVYQSGNTLKIEKKADKSPVTIADLRAHQVIHDGLVALTPQWPVLSEEEQIPPFSTRGHWPCYWLVDPLDGTKEFIERTGEFTINIALIEQGIATLGLIYLPLKGCAYVGVVGRGAQRVTAEGRESIRVSQSVPDDRVRVLTSRRHSGPTLEACLARLGEHFKAVERINAGSALKFCYLAEGKGDIYPRFAPCSEWDTAAGQALLEAAGGQLLDTTFSSLKYNQSESLINPHFYALAAPSVGWVTLLGC